jgi:hypothetical protein
MFRFANAVRAGPDCRNRATFECGETVLDYNKVLFDAVSHAASCNCDLNTSAVLSDYAEAKSVFNAAPLADISFGGHACLDRVYT